ncbi:hypothetical protein ATANTOWER_027699 [Ataeniobius toweri]|uniref:BED-type domain-containing protein n=1 Tax=Ataeniobius toweri TaxID=208326 RepID=A0ABU7BPH0_9TELE|nr:hypothetical protein [Ataeniobius toweri]
MEGIRAKIASGDYQIMDNTSPKAKSDIWKKFGGNRDHANDMVSGFAACKKCQKLLAFDSRKLGTSSLRKHNDSCKSTDSGTIDRYFSKDTALKTPKREDNMTQLQS